jgi:hypothetical protein
MARVGPLPASQGPAQELNTSGQAFPVRQTLGADLTGLVAPNGQGSAAAVKRLLGSNQGYAKYKRLAAGYGDDEAALSALGLTAEGPNGRYAVTGAAGTFYDPQERDALINRGPSEAGDEFGILPAGIGEIDAVLITDVPTSSTNYARPRTVAAGYDPSRQTMTVVFRDGTFYNYYEVSAQEWQAFSASYSKGSPWLNRGFPNGRQKTDGLFVSKPRGYADVSQVDPLIREQLYRVSRATQVSVRPSYRQKRYSGGVT